MQSFLNSPWFSAASLAVMVVGIPGTIDSALGWPKWLEGEASLAVFWIGSLFLVAHLVSVWHRGWEPYKSWVRRGHRIEDDPSADVVDYIGACAIIDAHIVPATRNMRSGVKLTVRQDFIERFDKVTGAKLGEYQYNGPLLDQWMQSNAARFLIEHRGEMV